MSMLHALSNELWSTDRRLAPLVGNTTYYRLTSVEGLRLNRAWTTYVDPTDPDLRAGGIQSIICFTEDGRFSDEQDQDPSSKRGA